MCGPGHREVHGADAAQARAAAEEPEDPDPDRAAPSQAQDGAGVQVSCTVLYYTVLYCTVLYCTVVSSSGRAMTDEEEKAEYARLLQELADLMENTERETAEFEQEMTEVQVS